MARRGWLGLDPELERELEAVLPSTGDNRATPGKRELARAHSLPPLVDVPPAAEGAAGRSYEFRIGRYLSNCADDDRARTPERLDALSFDAQESRVLGDVLDGLLGSPGGAVTVRPTDEAHDVVRYKFELDPRCRAAQPIVDLANEALAAATDYVVSLEFVERCAELGSGLVLQALGDAVRKLLDEYQVAVCRTEQTLREGRLSLQRVVYLVRPMQRSMQVISRLCEAFVAKRGAAAFSELERQWRQNEGGRDVLGHLLARGAIPLLDFIDSWMSEGMIDDPHGEFFLEATASEEPPAAGDGLGSESSASYRLRSEELPELIKSHSRKILLAGKYVNILRKCRAAREPDKPELDEVFWRRGFEYGTPRSEFSTTAYVNSRFSSASRMLTRYFMDELDLMGRLRSVKTFFFLDHGDAISHFLDLAEEELGKSVTRASPVKLTAQLQLALRTSSCKDMNYKDDVTCALAGGSLADQLSRITGAEGERGGPDSGSKSRARELRAFEALVLRYKVSWPLNSVLSAEVLTKYQLIFRHLFHCKLVERHLTTSWRTQSFKFVDSKPVFAKSSGLLARMLNFVQGYLSYVVLEVIEPATQRLYTDVRTTCTALRDITVAHDDFLSSCIKDCMLSSPRMFQVLNNLLSVCSLFANYSVRFSSSSLDECWNRVRSDPPPDESDDSAFLRELQELAWENRFHETVDKFDANFSAHFSTFLSGLQADSRVDKGKAAALTIRLETSLPLSMRSETVPS